MLCKKFFPIFANESETLFCRLASDLKALAQIVKLFVSPRKRGQSSYHQAVIMLGFALCRDKPPHIISFKLPRKFTVLAKKLYAEKSAIVALHFDTKKVMLRTAFASMTNTIPVPFSRVQKTQSSAYRQAPCSSEALLLPTLATGTASFSKRLHHLTASLNEKIVR